MARRPRIDLPGVTQHVIQRGNDRQACFFHDIDRIRYLQDLRELGMSQGCELHAYVLMTNHVHLLMTPVQPRAISTLMQSLGRRYVRYINDAYARTGTLWEGHYRSHAIAADEHLLRCYRYIELNPVRAGMVADPAHYPWSSYRRNAFGIANTAVQAHTCYTALSTSDAQRRVAYRDFVQQASGTDTDAFRDHLRRQQPMGNDRFRAAIEAQLGRSLASGKRGRPRKPDAAI